MQPTDELGQFIREQTPPVVLRRPFPACMHNPVRSSDAGNQPTEKLIPGVHTEFTHMHRGRPEQTVLYLSEAQPICPHENLLNRCLVFIKRRLRLVGPAPEKMTQNIPTWLLRKDTEK